MADMILKITGIAPDVIEINGTLREILEAKNHNIASHDFMDYAPTELYDRIVMNPPFEKGLDIDHVMQAYKMLTPGGRLSAIVSEGPFFRKDSKSAGFREFVESCGESHKVKDGAFKGAGSLRQTGVRVRRVVLDKPEAIAKAS